MPSGRQSRSEYKYHTVIPTPQVHNKSMRAGASIYTLLLSNTTSKYTRAFERATSDGRALSAQGDMPSGRQSRSEYRYHTYYCCSNTTSTQKEHARARRAMAERHLSDRLLLLYQRHKYTRACFQGGRTGEASGRRAMAECRLLSHRRAYEDARRAACPAQSTRAHTSIDTLLLLLYQHHTN